MDVGMRVSIKLRFALRVTEEILVFFERGFSALSGCWINFHSAHGIGYWLLIWLRLVFNGAAAVTVMFGVVVIVMTVFHNLMLLSESSVSECLETASAFQRLEGQ